MKRREFILAALAPAKGAIYRPVQIQKLFFVIDRNIPRLVNGPHFDFTPYNYGPFDKAVYEEVEQLVVEGYIEVCPERTWNSYRLTPQGQEYGDSLFNALPQKARDYIKRLTDFILPLSFAKLVSIIYKAFPEMRKNSVFQE